MRLDKKDKRDNGFYWTKQITAITTAIQNTIQYNGHFYFEPSNSQVRVVNPMR